MSLRPAEEHPGLPNPGQRCEFVHRRDQEGWEPSVNRSSTATMGSRSGTSQAIAQLNEWSKSEVTVKLVVKLGPFITCHLGCVRKFGSDADNIFYLEPDDGGGTFEFSPSDNRPTIRRNKTCTEVCFSRRGCL